MSPTTGCDPDPAVRGQLMCRDRPASPARRRALRQPSAIDPASVRSPPTPRRTWCRCHPAPIPWHVCESGRARRTKLRVTMPRGGVCPNGATNGRVTASSALPTRDRTCISRAGATSSRGRDQSSCVVPHRATCLPRCALASGFRRCPASSPPPIPIWCGLRRGSSRAYRISGCSRIRTSSNSPRYARHRFRRGLRANRPGGVRWLRLCRGHALALFYRPVIGPPQMRCGAAQWTPRFRQRRHLLRGRPRL